MLFPISLLRVSVLNRLSRVDPLQDRLLHVEAVLRLPEDDRLGGVDHIVGDIWANVNGVPVTFDQWFAIDPAGRSNFMTYFARCAYGPDVQISYQSKVPVPSGVVDAANCTGTTGEICDRALDLSTGDSVNYRSSTPHRVSNPGDESAEAYSATQDYEVVLRDSTR